MMDNASLVGKLRDIHPPLSDGVTTMLTMSVIGAITATAFAIYHYRRSRDAWDRFGKALQTLECSREFAAADRLVVQARVLREVTATIDPSAVLLYGEAWLSRLDAIFQTSFFTQGPGRVFGDELYKPASLTIVDDLDIEIGQLLARLKHVGH